MNEKCKTASFNELRLAAEAVVPYISTSLDINDILTMLSVVGDYQVTVSDGFPFAGMRNGGTRVVSEHSWYRLTLKRMW